MSSGSAAATTATASVATDNTHINKNPNTPSIIKHQKQQKQSSLRAYFVSSSSSVGGNGNGNPHHTTTTTTTTTTTGTTPGKSQSQSQSNSSTRSRRSRRTATSLNHHHNRKKKKKETETETDVPQKSTTSTEEEEEEEERKEEELTPMIQSSSSSSSSSPMAIASAAAAAATTNTTTTTAAAAVIMDDAESPPRSIVQVNHNHNHHQRATSSSLLQRKKRSRVFEDDDSDDNDSSEEDRDAIESLRSPKTQQENTNIHVGGCSSSHTEEEEEEEEEGTADPSCSPADSSPLSAASSIPPPPTRGASTTTTITKGHKKTRTTTDPTPSLSSSRLAQALKHKGVLPDHELVANARATWAADWDEEEGMTMDEPKKRELPYGVLCAAFAQIEGLSSRLAIQDILTTLFRQCFVCNVDVVPVLYLCCNQVAPAYQCVELGIGDSILTKAIAHATGRSVQHVKSSYASAGDLGTVAQTAKSSQTTLGGFFSATTPHHNKTQEKALTCPHVLSVFQQIASTKGSHSQKWKVDCIKKLLVRSADSRASNPSATTATTTTTTTHAAAAASAQLLQQQQQETKYLIRSLQGKLRIGLAESTVLISLAHAVALSVSETLPLPPHPPPVPKHPLPWEARQYLDTSLPPEKQLDAAVAILKRAYAQVPSYDEVVQACLRVPLSYLHTACTLTPGIPVAPMLAKPTRSIADLFKRLHGKGAFTCEYKYDGERAQVHVLADGQTKVFSRNLLDTSGKFPEVPLFVKEAIVLTNATHTNTHTIAPSSALTTTPSVHSCVLDAEIVAFNPQTGALVPFQVLSTRSKKTTANETMASSSSSSSATMIIPAATNPNNASTASTSSSSNNAVAVAMAKGGGDAGAGAGSVPATAPTTTTQQQVPVIVQAFDLMYLNGESLLSRTLEERRALLHKHFQPVPGKFQFAKFHNVGVVVNVVGQQEDVLHDEKNDVDDDDAAAGDTTAIEEFLEAAVKKGQCEGLMIKTLRTQANYEPSKRSLNWLKLKKDYLDDGTGLGDSFDLVPLGAYYGRGKRTGVYGAYLLACYDPDTEAFQSVCKVGTGFSDTDLQELSQALNEHIIPKKPSQYQTSDALHCDVWFDTVQVWEVKAADLSQSSAHRGAAGKLLFDDASGNHENRGIGLRFPRFERVRTDKRPTDATTSDQMLEFYYAQDSIMQGGMTGGDDLEEPDD